MINVSDRCTLVRAIVAANNTTASDHCTKGSGADTIVLPRNSTQRLSLETVGVSLIFLCGLLLMLRRASHEISNHA